MLNIRGFINKETISESEVIRLKEELEGIKSILLSYKMYTHLASCLYFLSHSKLMCILYNWMTDTLHSFWIPQIIHIKFHCIRSREYQIII
jgi:hypothetical protein